MIVNHIFHLFPLLIFILVEVHITIAHGYARYAAMITLSAPLALYGVDPLVTVG